MRNSGGSRRIVVHGVEYRWRAKGDDGFVTVGIWPHSNVGPFLQGSFAYHESRVEHGDGVMASASDQIVITGRLVRRIIELAILNHGYNPNQMGKDLNLGILDDVVEWRDAVRGRKSKKTSLDSEFDTPI